MVNVCIALVLHLEQDNNMNHHLSELAKRQNRVKKHPPWGGKKIFAENHQSH